MLLSYDALIGEIERGTMAQALPPHLAQPATLAGKFIGHLIILALATTAGYGFRYYLQLANGGFDIAAWQPFALLIAASVILGAAFLSIAGYLISAKVKERAVPPPVSPSAWRCFLSLLIWRFVFWLAILNKSLPRL